MEKSSIKGLDQDMTMELSSIAEEFMNIKFPIKRESSLKILANLSKGFVTAVSNFYTFDFSKNFSNIFLFAITVRDYIGVQNPHHGLIKKLSYSIKIKEFLKNYFVDYLITGNSLFGEPSMEMNELRFFICFKANKEEILEEKDIDNYPPENVYMITLLRKFNLKDFKNTQTSYNEKDHIKRFLNCILQRNLQNLNYLKSDPGQRCVYYKKGSPERVDCYEDKVSFVSGYKISTNFYENEVILLKAVQKYRMVRSETYYDFYLKFREEFYNNPMRAGEEFRKFAKGRQGLTIYSENKIQIDDVDLTMTPRRTTFVNKDGTVSDLLTYYKKKYNLTLQDPDQPLFVRLNKRRVKEGGWEENVNYFVPELLFVLGKLDDDRINFSEYTLLKPEEKFKRTNNVMKEIKRYQELNKVNNRVTDNNLNFNLIKMNLPVLADPTIILKGNKISPDETGNFDIKFNQPLENERLKNWYCFAIDVEEHEWNQIKEKMENIKKGLTIEFDEPILNVISNPNSKHKSEFGFYFEEAFAEIAKQEKQIKKKMEFIVLVTSKRYKWVYPYLKDSLNRSSLGIPSQVFLKENVLYKDLSVMTNIFLQIWAKRDLPTWKTNRFLANQVDFQSKTMVVSYSVGYNGRMNKSVTSIGATLNKDLNHNVYFSRYHESSGRVSPIAHQLIKKAINEYHEYNEKYPEQIIIFREGLNIAQRKMVVDRELSQILRELNENKATYGTVKVTFIFVNKMCDTKLFREVTKRKDSQGVEIYDLSIETNAQSNLINVPPGSLVDQTIVSNKEWEFYLNSTHSDRGTCSPTHYVVAYDNSGIEASYLYKLTYNLTFLYYNNTRCIRMPAPLKNAVKMTNFVIKYLDRDPHKMLLYNNFSL